MAFKAARGLCDNEGKCNERRVVSAKTSTDGVNWGPDAPLILPDQLDPPDLCAPRPGPPFCQAWRELLSGLGTLKSVVWQGVLSVPSVLRREHNAPRRPRSAV